MGVHAGKLKGYTACEVPDPDGQPALFMNMFDYPDFFQGLLAHTTRVADG